MGLGIWRLNSPLDQQRRIEMLALFDEWALLVTQTLRAIPPRDSQC